jgi:hypothetical protein
MAHPDLDRIGDSASFDASAALLLGRECEAFGPGALDHVHVSRRHARLEIGDDGRPRVTDEGSRNGTFFEGTRIEGTRPVESGLLAIGRVLLRLAPESSRPPPGSQRLATAAELLARGRPVVVVGEAGSGKRWFAEALHEAHGDGPWRELDVRRDAPVPWPDVDAAQPGTMFVPRIDEASEVHTADLARFVERLEARRDWRVVFTRRSPAPANPLAARLGPFSIELPPLRDDPERMAQLLAVFARRYGGPDARIDPALVIRLSRHAWPDNVRELEAIAERAVVEGAERELLAPFPALDAILAVPTRPELISTHGETVTDGPFVLAADGTWFQSPDGQRHDLASRRVLGRVLAELVAAHRRAPGAPVTVADLLAAGWPDERPVRKAGANRVYVALTTLRKLGLRELVARGDGGYSISPDAALRIVDA